MQADGLQSVWNSLPRTIYRRMLPHHHLYSEARSARFRTRSSGFGRYPWTSTLKRGSFSPEPFGFTTEDSKKIGVAWVEGIEDTALLNSSAKHPIQFILISASSPLRRRGSGSGLDGEEEERVQELRGPVYNVFLLEPIGYVVAIRCLCLYRNEGVWAFLKRGG